MSKNIKPVVGAATYGTCISSLKDKKFAVTMTITDDNGQKSVDEIQSFKTYEAALDSVDKWQIKENKSVLKN